MQHGLAFVGFLFRRPTLLCAYFGLNIPLEFGLIRTLFRDEAVVGGISRWPSTRFDDQQPAGSLPSLDASRMPPKYMLGSF